MVGASVEIQRGTIWRVKFSYASMGNWLPGSGFIKATSRL
jgi:hypothetical protein